MPEPLDARLRDEPVMDEIEMTSALMIAASSVHEHLSHDEIDEILHIETSE